MHKILITGGCGFIGSHLVEYFFLKYKKSQIIVYDKITYAANLKNLNSIKNKKRLSVITQNMFILLFLFHHKNHKPLQYKKT